MSRKKRKMHSGVKAKKNKRLVVLSVLVAALSSAFVLGIALYVIFGTTPKEPAAEDASVYEASFVELEKEDYEIEYLNSEIIDAIVTGGYTVSSSLRLRPLTVEMTDENRANFATIESCLIEDTTKVKVEITSEGIPRSDDKYYYLFEEATYEEGIAEDAEPLTRTYKSDAASFSFNLNKGEASSKLFSKFQVAVKLDGGYVSISDPKYITNPEGCAAYDYAGMEHDSIKGILPDPLRLDELSDLNLNYCAYNIPLSHILTTSGGLPYTYGGVTYHFKDTAIATYDYLFKKLNDMGIDIAAIVLNDANTSTYPYYTHPDARSGSTAPYYMFNGVTDDGVNAVAALASFLAGRYSGSGNGNVSMWIFANEVNARKEYNYMPYIEVNAYTEAFEKAFRVFYNGIKSQNKSARVYFSLDQRWTLNTKNTGDYDAKDFLDIFNEDIAAEGNIDWGLAAHPYSYPNNNTAFWKSSQYTDHTEETPVISMDNIEVLTNYLQKEQYLDTSGNVRSVILSEIGYSSTSGEKMQAAAFAYAYVKMEKNGYIDALMLSRQTDAQEEISAFGLALGLETSGGKRKYIYNVFKNIDTDKRDDVISFAYDVVGKHF